MSALLFVVSAMAGAPRFVSFTGGGLLLNDGRVTIDLDPADLKGVSIAARNLATDIGKVCGAEATVGRHADAKIVVGTIGHSAGIDRLASLGVINAKDLKGKCEKYIITTTGNQVVIAGSDRRGTIYGIYELSRQIGVSPWYWWADVPVEHHERIYIKGGTYTDGEPAVRYRGIFLNDEAPCLTSWVKNTYGTDYGGHDFYARVFELLLRLKANFMWPAMWGWSFYADDPLNSKTANEMGIIMGTSHHEPMARNHQEWARHRKQYGAWNYETNQKVIDDFFRLGVERAKDTEDLITIGMRCDGDEPMGGEDRNDSEYKTKDERNIALLRKIFKNQRAIIFACPWDCGDERADKVTVNGKSLKHLRADKYADYADHLVRYVDFMRQNGVGIYAISVQNEPDMDFTYWSPAEIVDFTKRFGQKIRATGTRLMGPESCGYNPDYTDAVLTDAEAMAQTDILAGHLYQGFLDTTQPYTAQRRKYVCGLYDNHLKSVGKTLWMTEHLFNDGQDKDNADNYLEFQKWTYCLNHLALEMHHCMEGNCSAYVYWYLKRFYGMIGDNDPERNTTPEGEPTKNGYIMAHYAKYAKGMDRIEASAAAPDLLVTAYANASRTEMTLVAINMGDGFRCLSIQLPSAEATAEAVETNDTVDMADAHAQVKGGKALVRMSGKGIVSVRIKM